MSTINTIRSRKLWGFLKDQDLIHLLDTISYKEYNIVPEIHAGDIETAIEYIKKHHTSPDILLIDISKIQMPMERIAALSEVCEPGIEVIVVGERNEVSIFRDLIKAGVRDYVVKPVPLTFLLRNFEEISGIESSGATRSGVFHKSGRLISVIGATGGSGVSTLVSNLGVILSENYLKHVAIVDANLQLGTVSQFFDLEPSTGLPQLFESPERIDKVLVDRYINFYTPNLGILSAQVALQQPPSIKIEAVDELFNILTSHFHFTLVDLPRYFMDGVNLHIFEKSNTVFIVTDYSITGLKDTKRLLDTLKVYPLLKHGIIIVANKIGKYQEGEISRSTFEAALEKEVSFEIHFDNKYALKALTHGEPIGKQQEAALRTEIDNLARHLLGFSAQSLAEGGLFQIVKDKMQHLFSAKG